MTLAITFILMYFIPLVIAVSRKHNNKAAIIALNVLLGWTMIGWIVAFVWAFTDNRKVQA